MDADEAGRIGAAQADLRDDVRVVERYGATIPETLASRGGLLVAPSAPIRLAQP